MNKTNLELLEVISNYGEEDVKDMLENLSNDLASIELAKRNIINSANELRGLTDKSRESLKKLETIFYKDKDNSLIQHKDLKNVYKVISLLNTELINKTTWSDEEYYKTLTFIRDHGKKKIHNGSFSVHSCFMHDKKTLLELAEISASTKGTRFNWRKNLDMISLLSFVVYYIDVTGDTSRLGYANFNKYDIETFPLPTDFCLRDNFGDWFTVLDLLGLEES